MICQESGERGMGLRVVLGYVVLGGSGVKSVYAVLYAWLINQS